MALEIWRLLSHSSSLFYMMTLLLFRNKKISDEFGFWVLVGREWGILCSFTILLLNETIMVLLNLDGREVLGDAEFVSKPWSRMSTSESARNVVFKYAMTVLHTPKMLTEMRYVLLKYRIFSFPLFQGDWSGDYIPVFYHSNHHP